MKAKKAIWCLICCSLLLSVFLIACNGEEFAINAVVATSPTHTTAASNNVDNSPSTLPIEETTAPMVDETTAPTEDPTIPTEPEETKAHEHNYSLVETVKPGCTQDGRKTYKCACGDTYAETTDARGYHVWGQ